MLWQSLVGPVVSHSGLWDVTATAGFKKKCVPLPLYSSQILLKLFLNTNLQGT
jgi:hypothetical protein